MCQRQFEEPGAEGSAARKFGRAIVGSGVRAVTCPHESLALEQSRTIVHTALGFVTGKQRRAIELVHLDGMSEVDAAEVEGVTRQALSKRIRVGLKAMREYLQSNGISSAAAFA